MRKYPALTAGVDVFTVQKLAGHADAVTTARDDRRGEEERRRAANHLTFPIQWRTSIQGNSLRILGSASAIPAGSEPPLRAPHDRQR